MFMQTILNEKVLYLKCLGDEKWVNKKPEVINKCQLQDDLLLRNIKDSMD